MKECKCKCTFTKDVQSSGTATWLFGICSFLIGIIIGFLVSPVRKGITIGCNNSIVSADDDDECKAKKKKSETPDRGKKIEDIDIKF